VVGVTPDCMDAAELAEWHDANRRVTGGAHAIAPCADCPAWFRAEAEAEGRCNGPIQRRLGRPIRLRPIRRCACAS
jgi:hypothetical protein